MKDFESFTAISSVLFCKNFSNVCPPGIFNSAKILSIAFQHHAFLHKNFAGELFETKIRF